MSAKIRIEFQSGSVIQGTLPDALALSFAYDELPTEITVGNCPTQIERKSNIQQILQVDALAAAFMQGYAIADSAVWRDLVEILYGSSGLADYDAEITAADTSTSGTVIYP